MKSGFSGAASDPNTFFGRSTPTLFVPLQDEDRVGRSPQCALFNCHFLDLDSCVVRLESLVSYFYLHCFVQILVDNKRVEKLSNLALKLM